MNYYNKDLLISTLNKVNTEYTELSHSDFGQGSAIISEYGGRPLGIFPTPESFSLLWINPRLSNIIRSNNRDIGGDRYWISPEQRFFYKDPENWKDWFCPPELDPAYYNILKKTHSSCLLKSEIFVVDQFSKEELEGKVKREIEIIKEPIKTNLPYVALNYRDKCVINKPNLDINGWSLATTISGGPKNPGTVLVPTKSNPKPISYFRTIPGKRLELGDNHVAFKIDVMDIYKLAIRPDDIDFERDAKIGYILKIPNSENYGLLIKLSNDIPRTQNECFDVARDHPHSEIGVIQSYNSESQDLNNLRYGEIELQLKPFETKNQNSIGVSNHQLIAYTGSKEDIFDTVECYLGIENPTLF